MGEIHVKNFWLLAEKVEEKNFFPVVFSHRIFCRVLGRFSA
jgi:hypothetical protein